MLQYNFYKLYTATYCYAVQRCLLVYMGQELLFLLTVQYIFHGLN